MVPSITSEDEEGATAALSEDQEMQEVEKVTGGDDKEPAKPN